MKNIRQKINEGFITEDIRELLRKELEELATFHPNSWDKQFTENMITYRKKLSQSQIRELERILQDPIIGEEHPNGIEF